MTRRNKYGVAPVSDKSGKPQLNKYGVAPVDERTHGGIVFASKAELKRWLDLKNLERAGVIKGLQRQVSFTLAHNGVMLCKYVADFVYTENGKPIVEDVKGFAPPIFRLKAKLMKAFHGVDIRITGGKK